MSELRIAECLHLFSENIFNKSIYLFLTLDCCLGDLNPDSKGSNIVVTVASRGEITTQERSDGIVNRMCDIVVGDETGIVTVRARNGKLFTVGSFLIL